VTSLLAHSVGLTLVLRQSSVNLLDDIGSDRAVEDGGDDMGLARRATIFADDADGRSGGHRFGISFPSMKSLLKLNLQLEMGNLIELRSQDWNPLVNGRELVVWFWGKKNVLLAPVLLCG